MFVNGANPSNPVGSYDMSAAGIVLRSGHVLQCTLYYDGANLQETVTDTVTNAVFIQTYAINIPGTVGGNSAYVGFTAATGGQAAIQNILTWTFTPLPQPPATPVNLAVAPASGSELDVSWSEPTGNTVDHFNILRATGAASGPFTQIAQVLGTQLMYPDGGLNGNTDYFYEVIAANAGGSSAPAGPKDAVTPMAPTPPINVQASGITTSSVTLSWQGTAANALGYKITRQLASNNSQPIATLGPSVSSYTDNSNLSPGSPYEYVVVAYNLAGPSAGVSVFLQTLALPPANLTAAGGADQVTLSWAASNGATGYNIYRGTAPGAEATTPVATNVTTTSFVDSGLTPGTTYYYQVTSIDGSGEGPRGAVETSAPAYLPGDVNGDGTVNFTDLIVVAQHYGATAATWAEGDLNGDGAVNFADLLIIARKYGHSIATPAAATAASAAAASPAISTDEIVHIGIPATHRAHRPRHGQTPLERNRIRQ